MKHDFFRYLTDAWRCGDVGYDFGVGTKILSLTSLCVGTYLPYPETISSIPDFCLFLQGFYPRSG